MKQQATGVLGLSVCDKTAELKAGWCEQDVVFGLSVLGTSWARARARAGTGHKHGHGRDLAWIGHGLGTGMGMLGTTQVSWARAGTRYGLGTGT